MNQAVMEQTEVRAPLFEPDELITRKVAKLYDATMDMTRNDFLSHGAIEALIGESRNTGSWGTVIEKWRRRVLKERGILVVNERDRGYRLATVGEQILDVPVSYVKKAGRTVRRAAKFVSAAPGFHMSDREKDIRAKTAHALKQGDIESRRAVRTLNAAVGPARTKHKHGKR